MECNITLIVAVVGIVQPVVMAVFGYLYHRAAKRRQDEAAQRAGELREAEKNASEWRAVVMYMLSATMETATATAICVKNGTVNGELERASESAHAAKAAYQKYLTKSTAKSGK